MSVPASVPKRSGRHLLRPIGQSGIRSWESYSSNSTTSPIFSLRRRVGQASSRARRLAKPMSTHLILCRAREADIETKSAPHSRRRHTGISPQWRQDRSRAAHSQPSKLVYHGALRQMQWPSQPRRGERQSMDPQVPSGCWKPPITAILKARRLQGETGPYAYWNTC